VSDYRESANKRRDERQQKCDVRAPSVSKKDTKKWCRGKIGVEHEPECVDYDQHKRSAIGSSWKLLVCKNCNKELDYWYPPRFPSFFIHRRQKPEWVCE
jgi:hypothetical protein